MRILTSRPAPQDFVSVSEFHSSAPSNFALEESPVLWKHATGQISGALGADADAELFISSNALHVYLPAAPAGYLLYYDEIELHALRKGSIYLQLRNLPQPDTESRPEIRDVTFNCPNTQEIYETLTKCIEFYDTVNSDGLTSDSQSLRSSDGYTGKEATIASLDLDLELGQADDLGSSYKSVDSSDEQDAGASVLIPSLLPQKRRRRS